MTTPVDSPRGWAMYALAVTIYISAIWQRSSFGVVGLEATERFGVLASVLSLFVVVQLLSTIPFAALMRARGWTPAFTMLAIVCFVSATASWTLIRNRPDAKRVHATIDGEFSFIETARSVWHNPATSLGFFLHAVAGFPGLVFAMMWGYPYLQRGIGLASSTISMLFVILVISGVVMGPVIGWLAPRHPLRLSNLSMAVAGANIVMLLVVISFERPPVWMLVLWMIAMSANAGGSNVGIEVARTRNVASRIGTATGMVIMGAFLFGVLGMWLFGAVLDLHGGYHPRAFRWAWASQLVLFALGFVGVYTLRPAVRRLNAAEGRVVPPWPDALGREWRRWRERVRKTPDEG